MKDELSIMRLVPGERQDIFNYFIRPDLLEMWAFPDGMKLRVPFFEAKIGGSYRFEHTANDGVYTCNGNIKDFQPGTKLYQVDNVFGPNGKPLFGKLETVTTFSVKPGGTFITITQKGFTNKKTLEECESGWNQCLDKLTSLLVGPSASFSGTHFALIN